MKLTKTMKQAVRRDRAGRPLSTRQRAALRELRRTRQHEHEQDTLGWRENKRVQGPERGLNAYRIKRARFDVARDANHSLR